MRPADATSVARSSADIFAAFRTAFDDALGARQESGREARYRVAHHVVRVRVAGPALADSVARPFRHLEAGAPGAPPSLRVDLWAGDETGTPKPPLVCDDDVGARHGTGGELRAVSGGGRFFRYETRDSSLWLDRATGQGVGWFASATRLSQYERCRPLHPVLGRRLVDLGLRLGHAGSVSGHGRGVLFPGVGRTGKTTAALACVCGGLDLLGDDLIAISREPNESWVGHSLYSSAKVEPSHLRRFPLLAGHALRSEDPADSKSLVFLGEALPDRLAADARIVALVFPRVGRADASKLSPMSGGKALLELVSGTLRVSDDPQSRDYFNLLAELTEGLPSYQLELGGDLWAIPPLIHDLVAN